MNTREITRDMWVLLLNLKVDRVFSRTMVANLNGFTDRPWSELRRGKDITEQWLALKLRPYAVRPRTIWIGEEHAKGYLVDDFGGVFRRYIPRAEAQALIAESRAGGSVNASRALRA